MTARKQIQIHVSALSFICLLSLVPCVLAFPKGSSPHDEERLGPLRRAGLRGERLQLPVLIAVLQEKPSPSPVLLRTTLHSVAQFGATDALPAIDNLIQTSSDQDIITYAKAARARLLAESNTNAGAELMLEQFYQELHESPADINSSVIAYRQSLKDHPLGPDATLRIPIGLYGMRELADMAYESQTASFLALPGIAQVNFSLDGRSALKVRLAPMSSAERVTWLIQDMSQRKTLSMDDYAEIQLAGDLGPPAGQAAAAKLAEMDQQKNTTPDIAFDALFGIVSMSGDVEPALWKHFEANADPYIAEYARRRGAGEFVEGY